MVRTSSSSIAFQEVGSEVVLPEGIYVVPPSTTGLTDVLKLNSVDPNCLSRFVMMDTIKDSDLGRTGNGIYFQSLYLTSLGGISSGTTGSTSTQVQVQGGRMLVTAGTQTGPNAWTLLNDGAIRGFSVSKYGVATLINNSDSLLNVTQ